MVFSQEGTTLPSRVPQRLINSMHSKLSAATHVLKALPQFLSFFLCEDIDIFTERLHK